MNTTIITILIVEIIVTVIAVFGLIRLSIAIKSCNKNVIAQNKLLKKMLPTTREIFTLTHEYIEMWKTEFLKKVEACGNLLGEITVYYIMHKIFRKHYENIETGFSFIKLFW